MTATSTTIITASTTVTEITVISPVDGAGSIIASEKDI